MAAAPQGGGQPDNSTGILWSLAAIFGILWFIWVAYKTAIIQFYFKIKLFEINIISYFTGSLDPIRATIMNTDPKRFTFQDVMTIGADVGDVLRYPLIVLVVLMAG